MAINYTDEETEELVKLYLEAEDKVAIIEVLMAKFDKPKKSIIGKLSKEAVYQKQTYKTKTGENPVTKLELVHNIAKMLDMNPEELQGVVKSPKLELQALIAALEKKLR